MRLTLEPHPDWPAKAVAGIEAEAVRTRVGGLELHYILTGAIGDLVIPSSAQSVRADGLWQHTCFEAFLRAPPSAAYYEFNFAPSSLWAAYHFDAYRDGMAAADLTALAIATNSNESRCELRAALNLAKSELPAAAPWSVGLSAVIEEKDGRKSYWALSHPPGKADFHHRDCFAHQLLAPEPI